MQQTERNMFATISGTTDTEIHKTQATVRE